MIKAIIFDMDGVIARTSYIQAQAESEVFAKIGIHITSDEMVKTYSGFKDIDMFNDILRRNKNNVDPLELGKQKWKIVYNEIAAKGFTEIPGAIDLIKKLKSSGFLLCVGSGTSLKFIQTILKELKISRKFNAVTSGDEVISGKPNPMIFLLCARKLNVAPSECLVIEDASNGIEAARKACMKCVAITTTATKEELKNADKIIDSFNELKVKDIQKL